MHFSSIKPTPKSIGSSIPLKPQRDVRGSSTLAWSDLEQLAALLNYACTLPRTPWESFSKRFLSRELPAS